MFGFIVSVIKFFFWWFVIGVLGAIVHWWGFSEYLSVTLGWMWNIVHGVYVFFVGVGEEWRKIQ